MDQFQGRVAVITGGGGGIGSAMARAFADRGARLVLADLTDAAMGDIAEELRAKGADVLTVPTDVTSLDAVRALADAAERRFGAVHIVCNNAGVASHGGPAWEQSEADWRWVIDVNLWGVIYGIRAFLPIMLARGDDGHVVNTASLAGLIALPNAGPYHASKFAVVGISESLYFDLAMAKSRIGVSVVCPAWVQTRILDSERNRPEHLAAGPPGPVRAELVSKFDAAFRKRISAEGIPAEVVADKVFEGVRDNRLYVLTHPEFTPAIERRCGYIATGENPDVAKTLGGMMKDLE